MEKNKELAPYIDREVFESFQNAMLDEADRAYPNPLEIKAKRAFIIGAHSAVGFFRTEFEKLNNLKMEIKK